MAVSPADHRFAPLSRKFQNASVLLAWPHAVYFQSVDRPTVAGKQFRDRNCLRSRFPGNERMVQGDQATASRESFKQFVVSSTPRSRLNSNVRFLDFTLRHATHSQVK